MAIITDFKSCAFLICIALIITICIGYTLLLCSITPGMIGVALLNGLYFLIFKVPLPKIAIWILSIVFSLVILAICCAVSEKGGVAIYIILSILTVAAGCGLENYIWQDNIFTWTFNLMRTFK